MTISNILTLIRFALAPAVFYSLLAGWGWLTIMFYLAGVGTDLADGRIARATGSVTPFGRAMDSAADKAIVVGGLMGLIGTAVISVCPVFLFVLREFVIFGIRNIRTPSGELIAGIEDLIGRARFLVMHCAMILMLIPSADAGIVDTGRLLMNISIVLAFVSFAYYISRDIHLLRSVMRRPK